MRRMSDESGLAEWGLGELTQSQTGSTGQDNVRSDTLGGEEGCANCSHRVPEVQYGEAKFHHQTRRASKSTERVKGSVPGGAWQRTKGAGKIKSKW